MENTLRPQIIYMIDAQAWDIVGRFLTRIPTVVYDHMKDGTSNVI